MIQLGLPLKHIKVTQPFGVNYVDFYRKLGLRGHNGIDFKSKRGCDVLATHYGIVIKTGRDGGGGIIIEVAKSKIGGSYKTVYYHLKNSLVKVGQVVNKGDIIGKADNTGYYTTGDHLHFGLKFILNGLTINTNNGYRGGIDPSQYFPKNWDKSRAYHRYNRKERNYKAEVKLAFKNVWVHKQMIKNYRKNPPLRAEQINAIIYGGWDFESIMNPAMRDNWLYLKKDEFLKGQKPFQ